MTKLEEAQEKLNDIAILANEVRVILKEEADDALYRQWIPIGGRIAAMQLQVSREADK